MMGQQRLNQGGLICFLERNIYVQTVKQGRIHTNWTITQKPVLIWPIM